MVRSSLRDLGFARSNHRFIAIVLSVDLLLSRCVAGLGFCICGYRPQYPDGAGRAGQSRPCGLFWSGCVCCRHWAYSPRHAGMGSCSGRSRDLRWACASSRPSDSPVKGALPRHRNARARRTRGSCDHHRKSLDRRSRWHVCCAVNVVWMARQWIQHMVLDIR